MPADERSLQDSIVIDTCCLVNLYAVGDPLTFLPTLPWIWHVPSAVADEGIYLKADPRTTELRAMRRARLHECFEAGAIQACSVEAGEVELYVTLAADLDDGEAMALTIAKSRGWQLATDDRKGRRKATELGVALVCTPQIMRRWATETSASANEIAAALKRIQIDARFVPSSDYPECEWWRAAINVQG